MAITADDFDRLIARDRKIVRVYAACVAVGLGIGLLVGLLSVLAWSDSERVTTMLRAGGVSVATLGSVLPFRAIRDRYEHIVHLNMLRQKWVDLTEGTDSDDEHEREEELVWLRQVLRDSYTRL
jgi:hypothetical protein